jgi:hypothetical protein
MSWPPPRFLVKARALPFLGKAVTSRWWSRWLPTLSSPPPRVGTADSDRLDEAREWNWRLALAMRH